MLYQSPNQQKNSYSISTAWNAKQHENAYAMVNQIKKIGFSDIELNFTLTMEMVHSISTMVRDESIRVESLHNFCPMPDGVLQNRASPDYYSLAAINEEERQAAVYNTKRTIEAAVGLSAKCVVLHCGRVAARDATRDLINLYREGKKESDEFMSLKEKIMSERQELADSHVDKVLMSLDELNSYATQRNIMLGIENRFYIMEIPSISEIATIMREYRDSSIYYWHDIGHAHVIEELGFARQIDFLNSYADRMAGLHIHDVKDCQDHISPGKGQVDFSKIRPFINDSHLKVIEVHASESEEDIKRSLTYLSEVFS